MTSDIEIRLCAIDTKQSIGFIEFMNYGTRRFGEMEVVETSDE